MRRMSLEPDAGRSAPAPESAEVAAQRAANETSETSVTKDLVLRARGGEAEAFGLLYDRYVGLVYRYVYYRVGSHAMAEDLTSDTFLRALRRMGDFSWQGKDFGAWLVTIARNLVVDHFKSSRHRLEISTPDLIESDRPDEGPERAVLDSMTNRVLLMAVGRLGSEQQECVVLRFLHGLSVAETAVAMGKKSGAIKALQYRAVRSLARMLPYEDVVA
jgi:RNA polymerase sigma-70 factor (ECF subfamily)